MRLYNPFNGAEFITASDDEDHVNVYLKAGWKPAPEPEAKPGYQPEPTIYAPVGTPVDDLDSKSKEELQDMLREQDKPVSGNKDELIARLRDQESVESTE
jgi:hypothetical protein